MLALRVVDCHGRVNGPFTIMPGEFFREAERATTTEFCVRVPLDSESFAGADPEILRTNSFFLADHTVVAGGWRLGKILQTAGQLDEGLVDLGK